MARVDVKGHLIPNGYAMYYDYFGEDYTCPKDVHSVVEALTDGEPLDVYINSGGGVIDVGSEIYTLLREVGAKHDVKIYVTGEACSAASIVAMAGYCEMSPTSLMMIHCVSCRARGNHNDMEHAAEMLETADHALCSAYTAKSGMTEEEVIAMMEHETWITASQAKDKGLIDAIMFDDNSRTSLYNAVGFKLPTEEQMENVRRLMMQKEKPSEEPFDDSAIRANLNLLKLNSRRPMHK